MALSPFDVVAQEADQRIAARAAPTVVVLSAPMKVDLAAYRGDTGQFRITVKDPGGNPVNISTYSWDGDIRLKANDPTVVTSFTITPVVGDTASIDVSLSVAEADLLVPGTLVYDIEMRSSGVVMTLIYGNLTVTQDVSRPT
jgi:hypothetical protein